MQLIVQSCKPNGCKCWEDSAHKWFVPHDSALGEWPLHFRMAELHVATLLPRGPITRYGAIAAWSSPCHLNTVGVRMEQFNTEHLLAEALVSLNILDNIIEKLPENAEGELVVITDCYKL